jgi:hypothetical protein
MLGWETICTAHTKASLTFIPVLNLNSGVRLLGWEKAVFGRRLYLGEWLYCLGRASVLEDAAGAFA